MMKFCIDDIYIYLLLADVKLHHDIYTCISQ